MCTVNVCIVYTIGTSAIRDVCIRILYIDCNRWPITFVVTYILFIHARAVILTVSKWEYVPIVLYRIIHRICQRNSNARPARETDAHVFEDEKNTAHGVIRFAVRQMPRRIWNHWPTCLHCSSRAKIRFFPKYPNSRTIILYNRNVLRCKSVYAFNNIMLVPEIWRTNHKVVTVLYTIL